MKKTIQTFAIQTLAITLMATIGFADIILYDSQGFENFNPGDVDGQFGFTSTDAASAYTIVNDPTGADRGNVLRVNDPNRVIARLNLPDSAGDKQDPITETMYQHIFFRANVGDGQFLVDVGGIGGQLFRIALDNGAANQLTILSREGGPAGTNTTRILENTSSYSPGDGVWHAFDIITRYTTDEDNRVQREFSLNINGEKMDTDPSSSFFTTWTAYPGEISYLEFNQLTSSTRSTYIDDFQILYNDSPLAIPEPASVVLILAGSAILFHLRRRKSA